MKDLCVPIPNFGDEGFAEIILKVGEKNIKYNYRVVSFPWNEVPEQTKFQDDLDLSLARIQKLRESIESYDAKWELIQIFTPSENAENIQVLYRMRP